jgi:arylsulfatase A-like enzyme
MNLILVTIDCLRADRLGCLGYAKKITPNLDHLASSGTLFRQAISVGSGTTPAFIAIFTSTYPLMRGGELYITSQRATLAQLLKERGYHTAAFHSNPWLSSYYGYHRGFDTFDDSIGRGRRRNLMSGVKELATSVIGRKNKLYQALALAYGATMYVTPYVKAEVLTEKAVSWLHDNPNNFFLWMHYMDVHQPYLPPQRVTSLFKRYRLFKLNHKAQAARNDASILSQGEINELIDLYDAEVSYVDKIVGSLLQALRRGNLLDNTLVVITADHGQQFREHGHYAHGLDLYDELIRVPLIIAGPGLEGKVIDQQVSLLDLAPTILDMLGIETPRDFLGKSLLPLVKGHRAKRGSLEAISETHYKRTLSGMKIKPRLDTRRRKISLRTGEWKYIYIDGEQDELYCLKDDPGERQNMIDVEPEMAAEMRAKIMAHIAFEDKSAPSEEKIIREKISRLKSSGRI